VVTPEGGSAWPRTAYNTLPQGAAASLKCLYRRPLARFQIGFTVWLRCRWNFSNISRCRACLDLRAEPSGPSRRKMKNSDKVHRPLLEALTAEMIPLRIQATIATSMVSPLPFPRPFEVRARFPSDQRTASISGND